MGVCGRERETEKEIESEYVCACLPVCFVWVRYTDFIQSKPVLFHLIQTNLSLLTVFLRVICLPSHILQMR